MDKDIEIIQSLLKSIHQYYPVGLLGFKNKYDGQSKLKSILEDKIISIQKNKLGQWMNVMDYLTKNYPGRIIDRNAIQFPCHQAWVEIDRTQNDICKLIRRVIINISLLCPFYTVFFEDHYNFSYFDEEFDSTDEKVIFFNLDRLKIDIKFDIDQLTEVISKSFPNHNFVSHDILFNQKIKSECIDVDYDFFDGELPAYPFYSFLFDSLYSLDNLQIL